MNGLNGGYIDERLRRKILRYMRKGVCTDARQSGDVQLTQMQTRTAQATMPQVERREQRCGPRKQPETYEKETRGAGDQKGHAYRYRLCRKTERTDLADGRKGEGGAVIFKIIALVIIALLLVTGYSLMVMAHRADERAERMYKRWQDERSNRKNDR